MMDSPKGGVVGRWTRARRAARVGAALLATTLFAGQVVAQPTDFRDLSPQDRAKWLENLEDVLDGAKLPPVLEPGPPDSLVPGPFPPGTRRWHLDGEGFVVLDNGKRPMGSRVFARSCYLRHDDSFEHWASAYSKHLRIAHLVATAITETGCSRAAGLSSVDRLSTGLMQVTGSTCLDLLRRLGRKGLTKKACLDKMATDPDFSIQLAAVYITQPAQIAMTNLDPPKVAAAYNAGGLYFDPHNPWRLRSTGNHIDRFVAAYNSYLGWRKDEDAGHHTRGPVLTLRQSVSLPEAVATVEDLAALSAQASDGDVVFVGDWEEKRGDFYVFVNGQWRGSLEESES